MATELGMMQHKVIIAGAGPAGLATAALLAREGIDVAVVAPRAQSDSRTVALMDPSLRLLQTINVWPSALQAKCAALKELHIIDDTGNTVSAPSLFFKSEELNLDAFGWNVPLVDLVSALEEFCSISGVKRYEVLITSVHHQSDALAISAENHLELSCKLLIAADGGSSTVRKLANVAVTETKYNQSALVAKFAHSAPHKSVSTEWHRLSGPFTTVPLPGNFSSLVWMARTAEVAALSKLDTAQLAKEIQLQSHGVLGRISHVENIHVIPMVLKAAAKLTAPRIIFIGEAAHQMPPIGAQGLNLSLRDAGHIADVVLTYDDPGSVNALLEYSALRRTETLLRQTSVGLLNWSLLSDFTPTAIARVTALASIGSFSFLRDLALRTGIADNSNLPFAMRKV